MTKTLITQYNDGLRTPEAVEARRAYDRVWRAAHPGYKKFRTRMYRHRDALRAVSLAMTALLALALPGCQVGVNTSPGLDLGMFITDDLKNAEAIAMAAHLDMVAACYGALEPVAMQTPNPPADKGITLATRYMILQAAAQNPNCAPILLPALLKIIGKFVPAPFGIVLPF